MFEWIVPTLAGVVALAFTAAVFRTMHGHPRAHQWAWFWGFALYAVASFAEALGAAGHWTVPLYRFYYVALATLVGALGAGTVYLLRSRLAGHVFLAFVIVAGLVVAAGAFFGAVDASKFALGADVGADALPKGAAPGYIALVVLNIVGGLALIVGALVSGWETRRPGVLLIGVGALIPFAGGSLAGLGLPQARVVAQLLGIVVMFVGYEYGNRAHAANAARVAGA
ncbi:MAG: hypothetical protein ACYDCK_09960 [Thermoplasmatota archaeon]